MRKMNLLSGLCGLFTIGFLAGCGNDNTANVSNVGADIGDTNAGEINVIKNDKLSVDADRCVGCGKCARIAPANFEMNSETRKAQVKSNEISSQTLVDRAVASCHPQAISQ